jgi:hypothetical protein
MDIHLNEQPDISQLKPLQYSMLINKDKANKSTVLDLKKLVEEFRLDIKSNYEPKQLPAFISKTYYEIQNLNKVDKSDFSYNYPPEGPIETDFMCLYCKKVGPSYHDTYCKRPFKSSLVLDKPSSRFPGAEKSTPYDLLVKKAGQKKVVSKHIRSEKFTDSVQIKYENVWEQNTEIRISRNGTINIISAAIGDTTLDTFIVSRINETSAVKTPPFKINPSQSYRYLVGAQFNLFPEELNKDFIINLNTINNNLWKLPLFKSTNNGKPVFTISDGTFYYVSDYNYNSGEQYSRSNKLTNPFIQFHLIGPGLPNIKIHVQIYVRGSVQLKASYVDANDRSVPLDYFVLEDTYTFLKELFDALIVYSHESEYDIIESEIKSQKKFEDVPNMVPGNYGLPTEKAIKKPKMCHNRGKAGGHDLRPVPYSFSGVCPEPGYYVAPRGIKRPDGKYEPCCYKIKKDGQDSKKRINQMLINGYPDLMAATYGESVPFHGTAARNFKDSDSAVFIPGTKIIENRGFPGLKSLSKEQLISCIRDRGQIRKPSVFDLIKLSTKLPPMNFEKIKTLSSMEIFTKENFMVTPVNNETIRVKLYFDANGKSYFINMFGDISESKISPIPELGQTIIDGYLYPFPEQFTFYPFDITLYLKKEISGLDFFKERFAYLNEAIQTINLAKKKLSVELTFDLNIISGSRNYLESLPDITGLLFIPYTGKNLRIWNDVQQSFTIDLDISFIADNRWKILDRGGIKIKNDLYKKGDNTIIELPIKFTKFLKGTTPTVLFKINLNKITLKVVEKNPFLPIEQIEGPVSSYDEINAILESIKNPITRETFTNPNGFELNGKVYTFQGIGKPLKAS